MSLRKKFDLVFDGSMGPHNGCIAISAKAPMASDFEDGNTSAFSLDIAFDTFLERWVGDEGFKGAYRTIKLGEISAQMTFKEARNLAARILEVCELADLEAKKAGLRRAP